MAYKEAPSPLSAPITEVLFVDIETVAEYETFDDLPIEGRIAFSNSYQKTEPDKPIDQIYSEKAGLLAEYSKVVCIGLGKINATAAGKAVRMKAIVGSNEVELLTSFATIITSSTNIKFLCAHNGKKFDFQFLPKRFLINNLPIPILLQTIGLKPWDVNLFDTLEMWQFTGMGYTSQDAICYALKLPSPKKEISGKDIHRLYWQVDLPWERGDNLKKIGVYCIGDIAALIAIYLTMIGVALITEENVVVELKDPEPKREE